MKEIVTRLHENRQVELAKSIMENHGYTVRLKESNVYTYKGPIYSDRHCTKKIADVNVEVSEQTPLAVAQAAGLDTSDSESSFFIRTLPKLKSGKTSQDLYEYEVDEQLRDKAESKAKEEFLNAHPDWDKDIGVLDLTASRSVINYKESPDQKIYATVQGIDEDGVTHEDTFIFSLK